MNVRFVTTHPEGWAVKAPNASRATGIHRTQREAEIEAKRIVKNLGGREVRIQDVIANGATQIRWRRATILSHHVIRSTTKLTGSVQ